MLKTSEVNVKSLLTPSKLPGADYVINPYSGCEFGCVYCYADFTRRFTGHMEDTWGEYVDIRINSPEVLRKQLSSLHRKMKIKKTQFKSGDKPVVFFGSVTDPYQDVEIKHQITRKCLEVLIDLGFDGEVSLLTKSPLVVRDIDLFSKFKNVYVGMTITAADDDVSRLFEAKAPPVSRRLKALRQLIDYGIETYGFVGPLLPHFVANESHLRDTFSSIEATGTEDIWIEHLNLSGSKWNRLEALIGNELGVDVLKQFKQSQSESYKDELAQMIQRILVEYKLNLVGGDVIDHHRL